MATVGNMPRQLPQDLRDLASLQRDVITRRQVQAAGLSQDVIASNIAGGRWQRLHAGVYALFSGQPDRQATLWAAVLRAGAGAALSYQTAAELDRIIDKPSRAIHVMIPASRRVAPIPGIILHARSDSRLAVHPTRLPPRTRLEETVLDLADSSDDVWDGIGWIVTALGRRLTTQDLLRERLNRRSRFRWRAAVSEVLSPDLAGVHSMLEFRYLHNVERPHRLPKATRQARAKQGELTEYRDVLYDEFAVAVELDGQIAHPGDKRWLDVHRDNAAAVCGVTTLRYGYRELTATPCLVAREVSDVLRFRGWRGSARPCSPGCPIALPPGAAS